MQHVEKTKSGSWQYRRRVRKGADGIILKREFKRKLGESEREAIAVYARYHGAVEREIASDKLAGFGQGRPVVHRKPSVKSSQKYPS